MSKARKCVLCAKQGKDVPVCPNNNVYCHFHMLCEMEKYSMKRKGRANAAESEVVG